MEYNIGSKIKAARLKKKMTQEQVAELLVVSRQTISNWENENSYPDIKPPFSQMGQSALHMLLSLLGTKKKQPFHNSCFLVHLWYVKVHAFQMNQLNSNMP